MMSLNDAINKAINRACEWDVNVVVNVKMLIGLLGAMREPMPDHPDYPTLSTAETYRCPTCHGVEGNGYGCVCPEEKKFCKKCGHNIGYCEHTRDPPRS